VDPDCVIEVRPLTDADRAEIETWCYPGDLSVYDPGAGAAALRAPDHVALASPDGTLLGYGTLGAEARVPGGVYPESAEIVDLGLGMRPELVGRGLGSAALAALAEYAASSRSLSRFRVTVASANARATALVLGAGFEPTLEFERARDGRAFVQYERPR